MRVGRPTERPPEPPTRDKRLDSGCYLTDGQQLFRVLGVVELNVELEDCAVPDGLPQWMPVREVLRKLTLVRAG